ncbi:MAG: YraN family protein [Inquilinus sp.]|nr:YraN family protein [Inquilinus sp.]
MRARVDWRRAENRGRRAESLCALVLALKGYRIVARRYRCPAGEVDIIARRGGALVAVEVKARADTGLAAESLGARQRARVERAALHFLAGSGAGIVPHSPDSLRFDVMLVAPWRWPCHIADAWRPDSGARGLGSW